MEKLLNDFEKNGLNKNAASGNPVMELDIPKIPEVILDNTDRNRTSPFPFIGNRFEFRAVGSTQNCSLPMMTLNTIVTDQLVIFKTEVDELIAKGTKKEQAIIKVLRRYIKESKNILFNGDGYSEKWEKEAKKRGLSNIKTTPYALDALVTDQSKELFSRNNVLNERELVARHEVLQEIYVNKIVTEACLVKELALTHIIPAAVEYQSRLVELYKGYVEMELTTAADDIKRQIKEIHGHTHGIRMNIAKMDKAGDKLDDTKSATEAAKLLVDTVTPMFDTIRDDADSLEVLIDDSCWKLPKYRELLFIK